MGQTLAFELTGNRIKRSSLDICPKILFCVFAECIRICGMRAAYAYARSFELPF